MICGVGVQVGATVGTRVGFLVAMGDGVSVAGTAVVGSKVGDGMGVSVGRGAKAVRVILTACSTAVVPV